MWGENSLRVVAGLCCACRKEPDTRSVNIIVTIIIILMIIVMIIMTIMLIVIIIVRNLFDGIAKLEHPWLAVSASHIEHRVQPGKYQSNHWYFHSNQFDQRCDQIDKKRCPHPLHHHLRIPLSPGSRWFPLSSARAPQTNLMLIRMMMIHMC